MGIAYINNGLIEIPNIQAQSGKPEVIADFERTAGGKLRKDIVAVKRTWALECPNLTKTQYDAIVSYLTGIAFGATTFWIDEIGGTAEANSITAYLDIDDDRRVQFNSGGTWVNNGHSLVLTVREQ